jgi:hypothetical protein
MKKQLPYPQINQSDRQFDPQINQSDRQFDPQINQSDRQFDPQINQSDRQLVGTQYYYIVLRRTLNTN